MIFEESVQPKYRDAINEAIETIIVRGNPGHIETATCIRDSKVRIDFVPLKQIGCSGVTGCSSPRNTNRRIRQEPIDLTDALGEIYIKFADWTFDVAGQRGCQGTIVHEGLHACDFARVISSFSNAEIEPLEVYDPTLYELERRAAIASAEYLVLIGTPDFIDDGLKLGLVALEPDGRPFVDIEGIEQRMGDGYGVTAEAPGITMGKMLGLRQKGEPSRLAKFFGFSS
jgi:hypothetical protein